MNAQPNSRIVARLRGGLGNQLFIYAAALALSRSSGRPLFLDMLSGFDRDFVYRRAALLSHFRISSSMLPAAATFAGRLGRARRVFIRMVRPNAWVADEALLAGYASLPANERTWYLEGLYQSESFFKEIADELRIEFSSTIDLPPHAKKEQADIVKSSNSVALCMRSFQEVPRGLNPCVIDSEFYQRAIVQMGHYIGALDIFVFSDNQEWARSLLKNVKGDVRFVSSIPTNEGGLYDLELMRCCNHHIIGNGTLHWWGAWLAGNRIGHVIVPAKYGSRAPNFYPQRWSLL